MPDRRPTLNDTERLRLFLLHDGVCHICSHAIAFGQRWEVEHVVPRGMIGKSADTDENMRPAHAHCHKRKTAQDADHLARAKRRERKHKGAHRPRFIMPGSRASAWKRCMDGRTVRREQPVVEAADA